MSIKAGTIHLMVGPMFAGKSDELINEYNSLLKSGLLKSQILAVKPSIDTRHKTIKSRTGRELECILLDKFEDVTKLITKDVKAILVDEYQFFGSSLVKTLKELKKDGLAIIVAGLDKDFRKIDMKRYGEMVDIADRETQLTARCHNCGSIALYSRKIVDGKPASRKSDTIEVDVDQSRVVYQAVCSKCHK